MVKFIRYLNKDSVYRLKSLKILVFKQKFASFDGCGYIKIRRQAGRPVSEIVI